MSGVQVVPLNQQVLSSTANPPQMALLAHQISQASRSMVPFSGRSYMLWGRLQSFPS